MTDHLKDRALAALLDVADDEHADGIARVIAAECVLKEASKRSKKKAKKK